MILQSGREIPDDAYESLLDEIIESIITMFASFKLEDFSDAVNIITQSLQEDGGWLPDNSNLTYEEAVEVMERAENPARHFADELANAYYKLRDKYVGTKSWELFK